MNKHYITLSDTDRLTLRDLLVRGTLSARKFKRATALLELDRGKTLHDVAATLQVHYTTVAAWRDGYTTTGLGCLDDAPRSGRPVEIDGIQRAKITALACSDAPEGHARWSLRLLAEKAVESHLCEHVSYIVVRDILKKRAKAPSTPDLVYWHHYGCLSGSLGTDFGTLCTSV
jgi:putative transposase